MLGGLMDRLPRFSMSFCSSRPGGLITTTAAQQARKLVRQGHLPKTEQQQPEICYHQAQQQDQDQDESVSFRCSSSRKKAVSWASSTVDNESTPKKSFHCKEYYFSQVFELNRQAYVGITPGSMQMKVIKRV